MEEKELVLEYQKKNYMEEEELVLEYQKKHPEYKTTEDYEFAWDSICGNFNAKVAWLSRGYLKNDRGYLFENTGEFGDPYIDASGYCNYHDWNNGYLRENFDLFKDKEAEVYAPLVFDSPEDYWAFVVKVKNKMYGIGE